MLHQLCDYFLGLLKPMQQQEEGRKKIPRMCLFLMPALSQVMASTPLVQPLSSGYKRGMGSSISDHPQPGNIKYGLGRIGGWTMFKSLSFKLDKPWLLTSGRVCHTKIHNFGIRIILSWRLLRSSRYKKSFLPSPICLKAEYKFGKVSLLPL